MAQGERLLAEGEVICGTLLLAKGERYLLDLVRYLLDLLDLVG